MSRRGDQALGVALGAAERRAIVVVGARDRDMNEKNQTAARAHGIEQSLHKRLMHRLRPVVRTVLQHAETIHDNIRLSVPQQLGQFRHIEAGDWDFSGPIAEFLALRHREPARHGGNGKATARQLARDEMTDQPGRAENHNALVAGSAHHDLSQQCPLRTTASQPSATE